MDDRGIVAVYPAGASDLTLHRKKSRSALGPHLPIPIVLEAPSPGVNRKGREAGHSAPSAEVKNEWSCNLTPSYAFMAGTGTGDVQNTCLDKSADGCVEHAVTYL
jgi:hypothetical protein